MGNGSTARLSVGGALAKTFLIGAGIRFCRLPPPDLGRCKLRRLYGTVYRRYARRWHCKLRRAGFFLSATSTMHLNDMGIVTEGEAAKRTSNTVSPVPNHTSRSPGYCRALPSPGLPSPSTSLHTLLCYAIHVKRRILCIKRSNSLYSVASPWRKQREAEETKKVKTTNTNDIPRTPKATDFA